MTEQASMSTTRDGTFSASFPVRIMPLFYILILAAIGFYRAPGTRYAVETLIGWELPQYVAWNFFNALLPIFGGVGGPENTLLVPLVSATLVAIAGLIYTFVIAPSSKFKATGIASMVIVTTILSAVVLYHRGNLRENVLGLDRGAAVIILRKPPACRGTYKV